jgi:hypothetical protein
MAVRDSLERLNKRRRDLPMDALALMADSMQRSLDSGEAAANPDTDAQRGMGKLLPEQVSGFRPKVEALLKKAA